eukprot:TRINITY_DN48592_c0_g1_i1.p1 TRINITY_DN48592_c0_g1~~TRINITY_DN48592_c0_g1_i1.p1  ORF type:complete len:121 (-),score=15.52 TRINITY_DN48592_c0_g1_i1:1-363(-)
MCTHGTQRRRLLCIVYRINYNLQKTVLCAQFQTLDLVYHVYPWNAKEKTLVYCVQNQLQFTEDCIVRTVSDSGFCVLCVPIENKCEDLCIVYRITDWTLNCVCVCVCLCCLLYTSDAADE